MVAKFSIYDLRSVRGGKGTSLCLVCFGRHLDNSSKWSFASNFLGPVISVYRSEVIWGLFVI